MASRYVVSALVLAVVAAGVGYWVAKDDVASVAQAESAAALAPAAGAPESADNPKVARVGDDVILKSDVDALYTMIKQRTPQGMPESDQVFWMLTEQMIGGRLLLQQARAEKMDQDPAVQSALRLASEQVLQEAYIRKAIAGLDSDAALKPLYEKFLTSVKTEKEVKARHILVKDEAKAKDLLAQIKAGADFAKLAKEHSEDPGSKDTGGDLGFFGREMMVPEFASVAFSLKKGELAPEPVKTQFGYHLIQVEDMKDRTPPSYEEMKGQLQQQAQQEKLNEVINGLRAKAKIERFEAAGVPPLPKLPLQEQLEKVADGAPPADPAQ